MKKTERGEILTDCSDSERASRPFHSRPKRGGSTEREPSPVRRRLGFMQMNIGDKLFHESDRIGRRSVLSAVTSLPLGYFDAKPFQ